MQGTIVKIVVAVGDEVAVGDPIVVLEAMGGGTPMRLAVSTSWATRQARKFDTP